MNDVGLASTGDHTIQQWSSSFTLLKQYTPHNYNISSLCWSHDNSFIGSISTQGDALSLTYTATSNYSYPVSIEDQCTCFGFNSNSRYVCTGSSSGIVRIWDLKTNLEKRSVNIHKKAVTSVTFNFNDADIASASESGEISICNVINGQFCKPFSVPNSQAVRKLRYSQIKKSLLAAISDDGVVNLWDTNKRSLIHSYSNAHKAPATDLAFSSVNEMLMMSVGLDKKILCLDVIHKKIVKVMVAEFPLTSIAIHPNGSIFAVGSTKGKIYIHDLRRSGKPLQCLDAHKASVQCLAFQNIVSDTEKITTQSLSSLNNTTTKSKSLQDVNANNSLPEVTPHNIANVAKVVKREKLDVEDAFSPMRETSTPPVSVDESIPTIKSPNKSIQLSKYNTSCEDLLSSQTQDTSQINLANNYADGIFSPIGGNLSVGGSFSKLSCTQSYNESPLSKASNQNTTIFMAKDTCSESVQKSAIKLMLNKTSESQHDDSIDNISKTQSQSSLTDGNLNQTTTQNILANENTTKINNDFTIELLQNIVKDTVDDIRESMRKDFINLYVDIIKQFQIQQTETRELILHQNAINEELITELTRLREENKRLKETY